MPQYRHPALNGDFGSQVQQLVGMLHPDTPTDPSSLVRMLSTGVPIPGLTGLDPKFFNDPRFDYSAHLVPGKEDPYTVIMGNDKRDDYDSAPIGAKSTLAVDEPTSQIQNDMMGKSIGPSEWFGQNTKDIQGSSPTVTGPMAEEMRRRMLNERTRIEDRY